jgi:hypothetical protein
MITYDLNTEDVANLIKAHLCEDLDITVEDDYTIVRSDSDKFFGMVKAYQAGEIVMTKEEHDKVILGSTAFDYTALFIAATPEGVFQFNLSLLRVGFESYTDPEAGVDTMAVDLDMSIGTQILEWYPEFESEDAYVDALMSNGDAIGYDESDTW